MHVKTVIASLTGSFLLAAGATIAAAQGGVGGSAGGGIGGVGGAGGSGSGSMNIPSAAGAAGTGSVPEVSQPSGGAPKADLPHGVTGAGDATGTLDSAPARADQGKSDAESSGVTKPQKSVSGAAGQSDKTGDVEGTVRGNANSETGSAGAHSHGSAGSHDVNTGLDSGGAPSGSSSSPPAYFGGGAQGSANKQ